jgi:hypothetical protein
MILCPQCKTPLNIGKLLASLPMTPAKQEASRRNGRKAGSKQKHKTLPALPQPATMQERKTL